MGMRVSFGMMCCVLGLADVAMLMMVRLARDECRGNGVRRMNYK